MKPQGLLERRGAVVLPSSPMRQHGSNIKASLAIMKTLGSLESEESEIHFPRELICQPSLIQGNKYMQRSLLYLREVASFVPGVGDGKKPGTAAPLK